MSKAEVTCCCSSWNSGGGGRSNVKNRKGESVIFAAPSVRRAVDQGTTLTFVLIRIGVDLLVSWRQLARLHDDFALNSESHYCSVSDILGMSCE